MTFTVDGSLIPARFMLAILAFSGNAIIYCLRVCLAVTMAAMVDQTVPGAMVTAIDECEDHSNQTLLLHGPFKWDMSSRNWIRSIYYLGHSVSPIPAGRLADMYSAKWVMFASVAINLVCVALFPTAAYIDPRALMSLRLIQGLAAGMMLPALATLIAHWSPPLERNSILGIIFSGTGFGLATSFLISGVVCTEWSWEWVFYLMVILSIPWLPLWAWLVRDYPYLQTHITEEELEMILEAMHDPVPPFKPHSVPWTEVIVCLPFWAILITSVGCMTSWYITTGASSAYLMLVHRKGIKEDALLLTVPSIVEWLFLLQLGFFLDFLRHKYHITQTVIRKSASAIAFLGGALALIVAGFAGCNKLLGNVSMVVYFSLMRAETCGYFGNIIDIAHNYAGTLMGIVVSVSTIPGAALPELLRMLIGDSPSVEKWAIVFYDTAALHVFFLMFYIIFGSSKREEWDRE